MFNEFDEFDEMSRKNFNKIDASLLLLGGGRGRRMGGNKLFLSIDRRPVVDGFLSALAPIFSGTVICVGAGESGVAGAILGEECVKVAEDREPGRGPLEGLRQGLYAMDTEWGFLLGIDMLRVQEAVVRQMWALTPESADVSAFIPKERPMALHAFYRKTCIPHIDAAISGEDKTARGGAKIISFFGGVTVKRITPSDLSHLPGYMRSFENYNTPAELDSLAIS